MAGSIAIASGAVKRGAFTSLPTKAGNDHSLAQGKMKFERSFFRHYY
jgi:hypothetical protein